MTEDPSIPPQPAWSSETRAWVSLLIFMHLFALFVAVTTYTRPSVMQEQLHELFSPYLRNLHMTAYPVSYPFARYYLTHALTTDVDFTCEVDVVGPGGKTETVLLPTEGLQPLVRWRRYQALANTAGTLGEGEDNDTYNSILPKAIAGSILKRRGASEGVIRLRAHYLPEIETMEDFLAGKLPPRRSDVYYEAQVFVSPSGIDLLKKSATLEVAPLKGARGTSGQSKKPGGPKP